MGVVFIRGEFDGVEIFALITGGEGAGGVTGFDLLGIGGGGFTVVAGRGVDCLLP